MEGKEPEGFFDRSSAASSCMAFLNSKKVAEQYRLLSVMQKKEKKPEMPLLNEPLTDKMLADILRYGAIGDQLNQYRIWSTWETRRASPVPLAVKQDDVAEIIRLHGLGMTNIDIAVAVRCHQNTVAKYLKRHEIKKIKEAGQQRARHDETGCVSAGRSAEIT